MCNESVALDYDRWNSILEIHLISRTFQPINFRWDLYLSRLCGRVFNIQGISCTIQSFAIHAVYLGSLSLLKVEVFQQSQLMTTIIEIVLWNMQIFVFTEYSVNRY